jgi:hypothetical protein
MLSSVKRTAIAVVATFVAGAGQAASLYLTPDSIAPSAVPSVANLSVFLDLTGVTAQGGGAEFTFSGVFSYVQFLPSAAFDDLNTDPDDTNQPPDADSDPDDNPFTGYGDPPGDAQLEIYVGDFAGITGLIQLGNILVNQAAGAPGAITVAPSPSNRWGGFVNLGGQPIAGFTYSGTTVVPLPATAWLLATGFGLAGFWRRRRG